MELLSRVKEIQETLSILNTKQTFTEEYTNDYREEMVELFAKRSNRNGTVYTREAIMNAFCHPAINFDYQRLSNQIAEAMQSSEPTSFEIIANPWRGFDEQNQDIIIDSDCRDT